MKDKKYNNAEEYNSDNINDIIQERKKSSITRFTSTFI